MLRAGATSEEWKAKSSDLRVGSLSIEAMGLIIFSSAFWTSKPFRARLNSRAIVHRDQFETFRRARWNSKGRQGAELGKQIRSKTAGGLIKLQREERQKKAKPN